MEPPTTHPLLSYAVYILIALALTWYLSRARGDGRTIGPGHIFVVQLWCKIFAALFFFGLPGVFFYIAPTTTDPQSAINLAVIMLIILSLAYLILATGRIEITETGLRISYLGWAGHYRFDEFARVSVYRFNIVLERKQGGMNVTFPAIFTNLAGLHDYLRSKIEHHQNAPSKRVR